MIIKNTELKRYAERIRREREKVFSWEDRLGAFIGAVVFICGTAAAFYFEKTVLGEAIWMILLRILGVIGSGIFLLLFLIEVLPFKYLFNKWAERMEEKIREEIEAEVEANFLNRKRQY
ncbi:MAG: hypothetical protein KAU62_02245 [Candidatus Heimdallarchaeota archaeon]|nr:hypothetical protein [Candidatus Heimdallarchaeota archaeon]MCK4609955.1 hypothetical protein [Candidatus Heimdallarchaeota archaeon]